MQLALAHSQLLRRQQSAHLCAPARRSLAPRCAAGPTQEASASVQPAAGRRLLSSDDDTFDLVAAARRKTSQSAPPAAEQGAAKSPVSEFVSKCVAAYRIFFPQRQRNLSPKEQGRNRLRMILVADRCAMNPSSLTDMKCAALPVLLLLSLFLLRRFPCCDCSPLHPAAPSTPPRSL